MRIKAQVTVYAVLSIMLVMTLMVTLFRSLLSYQSGTVADMAGWLAMESVFASYDNELFEQFGVFGLNEKNCSDNRFAYYAKNNIDGISYGKNTVFESGNICTKNMLMDNGAYGLGNEITEYMKSGIFSDLVQNLEELEKQQKKEECINKISQDISDVSTETIEIGINQIKIAGLADGLLVNDSGFVTSSGRPCITGSHFSKSILNGEISEKSTAVYDDRVYSSVSKEGNGYIQIDKLIEDISDVVASYRGACLEKNNTDIDTCEELYEKNIKILKDAVNNEIDDLEIIIDSLEELKNRENDFTNHIAESKKDIVNNKELLGSETADDLSQSFDEIKDDVKKNSIFDNNIMKEAAEDNRIVLIELGSSLKSIPDKLTDGSEDSIISKLEQIKESFSKLDNKNLQIDYSKLSFDGGGDGLSKIKKIRSALEDGISSIVLAGIEVHDGKVESDNLAQQYCIGEYGNWEMLDRILISQYAFDRFPNFSSYDDDTKKWSELYYPAEYIICGEDNDKSNINGVIKRISAAREAVNLAYLFSDSEKKEECMALAVTLTAAAGNYAITKAAQYLIMSVWAYGESLSDVRRLFKGDSLKMIKTSDDWKVSLEGLLNMNITKEADEEITNGENAGKTEKRLGMMAYEDYLRMFFLLQDTGKQIIRIAQAIELKMISEGEKDFRLKNYVFEAEGTMTVKNGIVGLFNQRRTRYSYLCGKA